jgi:hypothetical protein
LNVYTLFFAPILQVFIDKLLAAIDADRAGLLAMRSQVR